MLPNHRQRWWQGASVPSFEEEESCNFWWKNWRELGVFWFSTVQSLADEVWAREPLWEWHRRKGMEQHQLCQCILKCELVSLVWCFLFTLQFGIEDLKALPDQTSCWDGVRNYQVELQHRVLQKEDVYLKKGAMRCYSWKGFSVSAHCTTVQIIFEFAMLIFCRHAISWGRWKRGSWLSFTTATARSRG